MPDPELLLSMVFRACSVVAPAATHGWVEGPAETTPVEAIEVVPAVVESPNAPVKPFELLSMPPSPWGAWELVLCIDMLGFCVPDDLNVLRLAALLSRFPLTPPMGGSTVLSSWSSASTAAPPPPRPMLPMPASWTPAGAPAATAPPAAPSGAPPPPLRRSRMFGRPPLRSSPTAPGGPAAAPVGLSASLGAGPVASGVCARPPMLTVLLLALAPSLVEVCSGGMLRRLPVCRSGAEPDTRSFSVSRKSLK
mmetsp:Transcript_75752/g.239564  ORF Transcript_75752/g.239564 Transcript_75752/m.239564 type:complete len:251 (-) Transcript_75752:1044-1796(-)